MQAYEVLGDTKTRAAYDIYLAEQRRQSRRRFAHCAGLMMTSFVMTAASAVFLLSLAGANVPFRETWQLTVAILAPADATASASTKPDAGWTTQVAVAPEDSLVASPNRGELEPSPKVTSGTESKAAARRMAAPSDAPMAKAHHAAPEAAGSPAKSSRQQVATARRQASSSAVKRADPPPSFAPEESWPPAPPSDEPRYGLGASDLR
jgi:hypothetical protein